MKPGNMDEIKRCFEVVGSHFINYLPQSPVHIDVKNEPIIQVVLLVAIGITLVDGECKSECLFIFSFQTIPSCKQWD